MNAFFKCAELGSARFPLKELCKNFPMDNVTLEQLDRSLAKDLARAREDGQGSPDNNLKKDGAENPEGKRAGKEAPEASQTPEAKKSEKEGPETSQTPESKENREMTQEEINERQREAIRDAFERMRRGEELTDKEKGNLCEMLMDQYYISQGYTPIHSPRVTSLDDAGHKGIDGVYKKGNKYIIADAKYGQSKLGNTQDGRQMSWDWINSRRLDDAVGKEEADKIRRAYEENPDNVSTQVYHLELDPDFPNNGCAYGSIYHVNEDGEREGSETIEETYRDGEREETPAWDVRDGQWERASASETQSAGWTKKADSQMQREG